MAADREALVALYNATDGPNWVNNTNWLSDEPLREWHGVQIGESGRVVDVFLYANNLIGIEIKAPDGVWDLPNISFCF